MLRGSLLASELGCHGCHRPDGGKEIPNPGSRWGSVPRFRAGNAMMYASDCAEIEEFIRFGAPRAWLDDATAAERLSSQRLRMPAYEELLSDRDIADLTTFVCALEGVGLESDEPVTRGRSLAREHGCTSCHGVGGAGGVANPRSLGGFIPGFLGRNFEHLVRDRPEFGEWVRTGQLERLAGHPIVARFWNRQAISMPAYEETLNEEDIDALWAWVLATRDAS